MGHWDVATGSAGGFHAGDVIQVTLLQPAGLWLLCSLPVIVLLHALRSKPRREPIGASFLWRELAIEAPAKRRFRVPPLSLALMLQLLVATALSIAAAQPTSLGPPRQHLIVVLDASASMLATDETPSRFVEAVRRADAMLSALGPADRASVIRAANEPKLLIESSAAPAAREVLSEQRASAGSSRLSEALGVAVAVANRDTERAPSIIAFSDGATLDGDAIELPSTEGVVSARIEHIGHMGENQAVTGLSFRTVDESGSAGTVAVRLANFAPQPVRRALAVSVDDAVVDRRDVTLPARGRIDVVVPAEAGGHRVTAALDGSDTLGADDRAEIRVPGPYSGIVTLVSRSPEPLERALRSIPSLRVRTLGVERLAEIVTSRDIVILDSVLSNPLPAGPLMLINPPSEGSPVRLQGPPTDGFIVSIDRNHPLLASVDLVGARAAKAAVVAPPVWAGIVAESERGPLIVAGLQAGRPVAIIAFDPIASGFDRQLALPLIMTNAVQWLSMDPLAPSFRSGQRMELTAIGFGERARLRLPNGQFRSLAVNNSTVLLDDVDEPGRYQLDAPPSGPGSAERVFSVNVTDERESNIAPRRLDLRLGNSSNTTTRRDTPFDFWPYLNGLILALLALEWWRFGRRGT